MAFGISREELKLWKQRVRKGEIAFLTHYWLDDRFPGCDTVTKDGWSDVEKLMSRGRKYGLSDHWIDYKTDYPHYDLFGEYQREILRQEQIWDQIERFKI